LDFKALIDFVKYTLALAAAELAYAVEAFRDGGVARGTALGILGTLFVSLLLGILVFAAATSALHPQKKEGVKESLQKIIKHAGTVHSILLVIGTAWLGVVLISGIP